MWQSYCISFNGIIVSCDPFKLIYGNPNYLPSLLSFYKASINKIGNIYLWSALEKNLTVNGIKIQILDSV